MGAAFSSLREVALSITPFRLNNDAWEGWQLDEIDSEKTTVIANYPTATPAIILSRTGKLVCVVIDGREVTMSDTAFASGWRLYSPRKI